MVSEKRKEHILEQIKDLEYNIEESKKREARERKSQVVWGQCLADYRRELEEGLDK